MKTYRLLVLSLIALLSAPPITQAVTDTWNGGSPFNDNFSSNSNWDDNSAPASSTALTDLYFAGFTRLTPNVSVEFSTHSVEFSSVAGAFVIGGELLKVGGGGIANNNALAMTFTNPVTFSGGGTVTLSTGAGGLNFTNVVTVNPSGFTVAGSGPSSFNEIVKTGPNTALYKEGSGTMIWGPSALIDFPVVVIAGTMTLAADGNVNVFTSDALVAVNGTSTLNMNESFTLDGAQLTRESGAHLNLAAGKTFRVQAGGDAIMTGAFAQTTSGTITVTGAGSTLSTAGGALTLGGGGTTNVALGGSLSAGASVLNVGTSGNGFVNVTNGSSLSGGTLVIGRFGDTGAVTLSTASTGTFSAIDVDVAGAAGTSGTLTLQSVAQVKSAGLNVATSTVDNDGVVTITGNGSWLELTGAATANIGATINSTGTLNVNSEGAFSSGTGLTTVRATGTIAINGGEYYSRGNLRIDGGELTRDETGLLVLDPGKTLTLQNGGDVTIDGTFVNNTASTITVTGAGSTFRFEDMSVNGGSTLGLLLGGEAISAAGPIRIGTAGGGAVAVDGAGSKLSSAGAIIGESGNSGSLSFTNGSTGKLSTIEVDNSGIAGTSGLLQIQSGAAVTGFSLVVADGLKANTGTVTINGLNSALTLTGGSPSTIGAANETSGTLNVQSLGTFNSGPGLMTVNATGTIAITDGTFNENGNLTLNGGKLTRDAAGLFSLDAGRTLRMQAGGDAIFTGAFTNSTGSAIVVTGAGSTLSTTSHLNLQGGSTMNVTAGGNVSTGVGNVNIGLTGGDGTVTVAGAGAGLSGNTLNLASSGFTGNLSFTNGSTGTFNTLSVTASATAGTTGTLSIQSGANVTGTRLSVGSSSVANTGTVTIGGLGSALTLNGALTSTIGAPTLSTGTVTVGSGGIFTTGSGLTNVQATGTLNVQAGATLTGASDFGGTGPINIAGAYKPGAASGANQTTSASFGQNMSFFLSTNITMELGGVTAGTEHDQLVFNGPGAPQVTWAGALNVVLINGFVPQAGHTFDLLDFDPARGSGVFAAVNLPALTAGLVWRTENLYVNGTVRVSFTPNSYAEWKSIYGTGEFDADDDGDGIPNGIEFLLGSHPKQAFVGGGLRPTELTPITSATDTTARLTFDMPADPSFDARYRVAASDDLATWTIIASKDGAGAWSGTASVTTEPAVSGLTRIIVAEALPLGSGKRFHRLEALNPLLPF